MRKPHASDDHRAMLYIHPVRGNLRLRRPGGTPLNVLQTRLRALPSAMLASLRRGIEKESLRVRPDGALAVTPHPQGLGSALTHPHITTDFCESQLELITGVHPSAQACMDEITHIH